jgi:hypothetical protein
LVGRACARQDVRIAKAVDAAVGGVQRPHVEALTGEAMRRRRLVPVFEHIGVMHTNPELVTQRARRLPRSGVDDHVAAVRRYDLAGPIAR